jgi:hypothetical protein
MRAPSPALTFALCIPACATTDATPSSLGCAVEQREGECEPTVTLSPREPEDPQEATSLIVRWEWLGDTPAEVPDRTRVHHLSWREASARAATIDEVDKSRCVIEVATDPATCAVKAAIIFVEAEP